MNCVVTNCDYHRYKTNMPVAARKFLAEIRPENRGYVAAVHSWAHLHVAI